MLAISFPPIIASNYIAQLLEEFICSCVCVQSLGKKCLKKLTLFQWNNFILTRMAKIENIENKKYWLARLYEKPK